MNFTREKILGWAKTVSLLGPESDKAQEDKLLKFAALVGRGILEQQAKERQALLLECRPMGARPSWQ